MRATVLCVLALTVGLVFGAPSWAAEPTVTTITIPNMDCMGCAKKIANKVYEVPGVAEVRVDLEAKKLLVTPKPKAALSPLALWAAVENAKEAPSKLAGPSGAFTSKPKQ